MSLSSSLLSKGIPCTFDLRNVRVKCHPKTEDALRLRWRLTVLRLESAMTRDLMASGQHTGERIVRSLFMVRRRTTYPWGRYIVFDLSLPPFCSKLKPSADLVI